MNKTTALIFFGIIVLGIIISLFTLKSCKKEVDPVPDNTSTEVEGGESTRPEDDAATGKGKAQPAEKPVASGPGKGTDPVATVAEPAKPAPVPAPAASDSGTFKSPEAAMTALAAKFAAKDFPGFVEITGAEALADEIKDRVKALVENPELDIRKNKPYSEISKSADSVRWALNLAPVSGEPSETQLYADLKETAENTFEITGISFPLELSRSLEAPVADPGSPGTATPAPPLAAPSSSSAAGGTPGDDPPPRGQKPDALTVAHAFSKAVIQRDFNTARKLSDPSTVTDERVAALMIAVEEGKFSLKEERPLVVTLSREDITWVLARVQSETAASEFALELGQINADWKVNGLTFSKVLSVLSEQAGGGDVAYTPIVDDPSGGDSLVLYFEFDESGLTSRTERQLAIVAGILKQGPERVIRINGHADALGSDDYNVGLSDRRAESIRQALIGAGVKPDQVITEAFGAAKPRKPNFLPDGSDNPSGRSENRRAEVLLDF